MQRKILLLFFIIIFTASSRAAAEYNRVISLAPAITESIYALGAEEKLVGVTNYCDYPVQAQEKEKVGGFINPNIEKIVTLHPDVVIVSPNSGTKSVQQRLASFGIQTLVVDFYSLKGLIETYQVLGKTLNRNEEAVQLIDKLNRTIATVQGKVEGYEGPRLLFVRSHIPFHVAGRGTFEDDIITMAGGQNCITNNTVRYPRYNFEEIIKANPHIIIDATYYDTPNEEQLRALQQFWSSWPMLDAVKSKRIYIIKTDLHSVPGPRTPHFITIVAALIHPEVFGTEEDFVQRIPLGKDTR
jgi:iron complex transport system substrate-binding protein